MRKTLTVLAILFAIALLVSGVWGGASALHESDPGVRAQRQFDLYKDQAEFAWTMRVRSQDEERWAPVWDALAFAMRWVILPTGIGVGLGLIAAASVLWAVDTAVSRFIARLNALQFVAPHEPRWMAMRGDSLYLAEQETYWQGQIGLALANNPAAHINLKDAPNLRSLVFKSGNVAARPTAQTPHPQAEIEPGRAVPNRLLTLADLGTTNDRYAIPYGLDDKGDTVWSNVISRHRLIGGSTGSGKSNLVQTQVVTLNKANSPSTLLNYFFDPKDVAFKPFKSEATTAGFAKDGEAVTDLLKEVECLRQLRQSQINDQSYAEWFPGIEFNGHPMPFVMLWVDELGTVTLLPENHRLLNEIVKQGRSAGISFTGLAQLTNITTAVEDIRNNCIERACGFVPTFQGSVAILGRSGAENTPNEPGYFTVNINGEFQVVRAPHAGYLPRPGEKQLQPTPPAPGLAPDLAPAGPVERTDKEEVVDFINLMGRPVSKTELYNHFNNRILRPRLDAILAELSTEGFETHKQASGGAPRILTGLARWFTKEG